MASMMPSKSALYRSCTIFWSSTSALEFEAARNHAGGNGIGVPVELPAEAAAGSAKLADAPAPLVEVMIWWPVPDEPADGVVADSVMWKLRNRVLAASLAMTPSMRFGIQRSGNGSLGNPIQELGIPCSTLPLEVFRGNHRTDLPCGSSGHSRRHKDPFRKRFGNLRELSLGNWLETAPNVRVADHPPETTVTPFPLTGLSFSSVALRNSFCSA